MTPVHGLFFIFSRLILKLNCWPDFLMNHLAQEPDAAASSKWVKDPLETVTKTLGPDDERIIHRTKTFIHLQSLYLTTCLKVTCWRQVQRQESQRGGGGWRRQTPTHLGLLEAFQPISRADKGGQEMCSLRLLTLLHKYQPPTQEIHELKKGL